jgi:hypothetical protein
VDYVRSCYTIEMQFDLDGDLIAPVTYYFASPEALQWEGENAFCSANYLSSGTVNLGLGERWDSTPAWSDGVNPGPFSGTHRQCGPRHWWREGVPSDAPPLTYDTRGLPICCGVPMVSLGTLGAKLAVLNTRCQPWHVFGPPARSFTRLLTGEVWVPTLSTTVQYTAHGVAFPTDLLAITSGGGTSCQGFGVTNPLHITVPTHGVYTLQLQNYDPSIFTGLWQMPAGAAHYPSELFAWKNPT